jgi:hypothetical protein
MVGPTYCRKRAQNGALTLIIAELGYTPEEKLLGKTVCSVNLNEKRSGIAAMFIIIVIIVIVLVASVGAFYALSSGGSHSTTTLATTPSFTTATSSSHSSTVTPSSSSSTKTVVSSSQATATQSGMHTYSGTFNYSIPVGPSGVRSFSNDTVQVYNSTMTASGTFTFFIAPLNESGSGSGHGTITVATHGFCSGSTTISYTFLVPDATSLLGGNITIFFSNPQPGNYSVPLTCTGPMAGVSTATNNPGPFLPEYPGEFSVSISSLPASVIFHPGPGFVYGVSVKETS